MTKEICPLIEASKDDFGNTWDNYIPAECRRCFDSATDAVVTEDADYTEQYFADELEEDRCTNVGMRIGDDPTTRTVFNEVEIEDRGLLCYTETTFTCPRA